MISISNFSLTCGLSWMGDGCFYMDSDGFVCKNRGRNRGKMMTVNCCSFPLPCVLSLVLFCFQDLSWREKEVFGHGSNETFIYWLFLTLFFVCFIGSEPLFLKKKKNKSLWVYLSCCPTHASYLPPIEKTNELMEHIERKFYFIQDIVTTRKLLFSRLLYVYILICFMRDVSLSDEIITIILSSVL